MAARETLPAWLRRTCSFCCPVSTATLHSFGAVRGCATALYSRTELRSAPRKVGCESHQLRLEQAACWLRLADCALDVVHGSSQRLLVQAQVRGAVAQLRVLAGHKPRADVAKGNEPALHSVWGGAQQRRVACVSCQGSDGARTRQTTLRTRTRLRGGWPRLRVPRAGTARRAGGP